MIYSESGLVEEGAVFRTPLEGEEDTVSVVTRHDKKPVQSILSALLPAPEHVCWIFRQTSSDDNSSFVHIRYVYTGTTSEGNDFIDGFTEEAFVEAMNFWEKSMNYFIETGQRLKKM